MPRVRRWSACSFLYAVYVFLIDGPTYYRWLEEHAPIEATPTRRLVGPSMRLAADSSSVLP